MKKACLIWFLLSITCAVNAADPDSSNVKINVEGFLDVYYAYDFTNENATDRQAFLYNHNRNNAISVNLALAKFTAEYDRFRSNVTLQVGDYVHYNLAHEPNAVKNIYEAYAGFKVNDKIWVDAGVFSSNLGFESAISTENITLTRSLVAENSPYYLSGIKATYQINDKLTFTGLISNGWQIIADNNKGKAFGTQLEFAPNDNISFNYSTFIGKERSAVEPWRVFHDFYTKLKFGDKINVIVAFDYGTEPDTVLLARTRDWFGLAALLQYTLNDKISIGLRGEHYNDWYGINASTASLTNPNPGPFETSGTSFNVDFKPNKNTIWRTEFRSFLGRNDIFSNGRLGGMTNSNHTLITSLAFKF